MSTDHHQETLQGHDIYNLWAGQDKPFYKENDLQEYADSWETIRCIYNITEPTLTVYRAEGENSGKAVIVIPGGGYEFVCMEHEGYDIAKVLAEHGITAAVLKYRLPNPESSDQPQLVPLTDLRRAIALFREKTAQYGFQKESVGVVGFSAGSHLATVASLWESPTKEENPDFTGLIYGVTNFADGRLGWLENALYFRKLTEEEAAQNQLLDLVSQAAPPAFLAHAYDDGTCHVKETTLYAEKLSEHQVPVEMHVFPKGGHGFGLGRKEDGTDQWIQLFINWVKRYNG